ncbi:MAG: hypothetical protein K6E98_00500 [Lachnospiraceae bacterium]|nr:hypothetical protein [Lachnospiraceae bacterium]
MKSIFEQIDEVVRLNGCVPKGFKLENSLKNGETEKKFPGSDEGLISKTLADPQDEMVDNAYKMIKNNVKINAKLAVHNFDDNELGFTVAKVRGHLLKKIIGNIKDFDPHKLSTLAYSLVEFGNKEETVKLGLLLLILFDFADDEIVKKHLITMGLYEEFTGYILANVKGWPENERNHVYYIYAKKLNGWGKINAMELLEPVNDEVKEWILTDGCRNDISYNYIAKIAYEKGEVIKRLKKGKLSNEEMQGVSDIVHGLLEEGPEKGISTVKNPARLSMLYIKELSRHTVSLQDLVNIFELKSFILSKDNRSKPEEKENAVKLLERMIGLCDCEDMIKGGLIDDTGLALWTAKEAGVDVSEVLIGQIKYNFYDYYQYGYYLMESGAYVDDYLELCEKYLDGKDFKEGMGSELSLPDSESFWQLDIVVQYLSLYPGKGEKLINTAVNSSILRFRKVASKVLKDWEKVENRNLKKINGDIFKNVKKVRKKEVDESLKKSWDKILEYKPV